MNLLKNQSDLHKAKMETGAFRYPKLKENLDSLLSVKNSAFYEQVYNITNENVDEKMLRIEKEMGIIVNIYSEKKHEYSDYVCNIIDDYFK